MLINLDAQQPDAQLIKELVAILEKDGVIIYPTDTSYAFGCAVDSKKGIDKICKIRGKKLAESHFSLVCNDMSMLSDYTIPFGNATFRAMKRTLPGPFTFILRSNNQVPKIFKKQVKEIGIRIPNHQVPLALVSQLGKPMLTASLVADGDANHFNNPDDIDKEWGKRVESIINCGPITFGNTTIVDCVDDELSVVREGRGDIALLQ